SHAGPRAAGHRVASGPTIPSVRYRRCPLPWGTDRRDTNEGPAPAWPARTRHADPPGPSEVALRSAAADQSNESPEAPEPPAFGVSMVKPCYSIVSEKSMVEPLR